MPTWKAYAKKDDITATKLDDFAAPDDNTDLNASATAHGLLPKLSNVVTEFLNGTGVFSVPAAGGGVKAKTITREMTAASGDVSYTGIGFTPTALLFFGSVQAASNTISSHGSSDAQKYYTRQYALSSSSFAVDNNGCIRLGSTTNYQSAIVESYDADGFTLTWTKIGSPAANTANILVVAFA
jgi:hypothetical protein